MNLPDLDPEKDVTVKQRKGSGCDGTPDFSLLPESNYQIKTKWYEESIFRLNQGFVTPQQLLDKAFNCQINWNTDVLKCYRDKLEKKGRTWNPIALSPWICLRKPTTVTSSTPLPWFFFWEDPPAVLSGAMMRMCWEWGDAVLLSLDELNERAPKLPHALVMPFQHAFFEDDGIPHCGDTMCLQAAWIPSFSLCPHVPVSKGREDMEFILYDGLYCIGRVTLKELEDACMVGFASATEISFRIPLNAYPQDFKFDSVCWPSHIPLPAAGWKCDLAPRIFNLFPAIARSEKLSKKKFKGRLR